MKEFWKEHGGGILLFLLCASVYFVVFGLYHEPLGVVFYPTVLCALLILGYLVIRVRRSRRKRDELKRLACLPDDLMEVLKKYDRREDRDYQNILAALEQLRIQERTEYESLLSDSMDYYSAWVHQIKTPIASMRLRLEQEDSSLSRGLCEDLFRIEQYVGMVLTYQRLQSDSTDYVFREYSLEQLVKGVVRKFAAQFIGRGIRLELQIPERMLVTDDKWFSFVLEQILSNALKYTREGSISIYLEEPYVLCIRDTGIGIAPEDLPRIFEKGYTGENGRVEKSASGLGLYLCKAVCGKLGFDISASSEPGVGTVIRLNLEQKQSVYE